MKRRPRPAAPGAAIVAWGWYAVTTAPLAPVAGGNAPGLVPRLPEGRAFWAAWWTSDPRREWVDPDDFGFVEGAPATISGEGITAADRRVREAMGRSVFARSIGEDFAKRAYREGAPQRRAGTTDFAAVAAAWLEERGLPPTASVEVVKRAWRDWLKANHGGEGAVGIDLELERRRYDAALAAARAREAGQIRERQRATIAAGARPVDVGARVRAIAKRATKIAADVRARLEVLARELGVPESLAGLCHFAALGLVEALRAEDLHAVVATTGGHSFAHVLVDGARGPILVDITATQYRLAPVYVRQPGQKRRWTHEARLKGTRARDGAAEVAAADVESAPARWWALAPSKLPAAMRRAGTRLTAQGQRLAPAIPDARQTIAVGKLDDLLGALDGGKAPAGAAGRSGIARAIDAVVRCVKCGGPFGCGCWTKCSCGWSYETGGTCNNPVHAATTKKKRTKRAGTRAEV